MTNFTADWLSLREEADTEARSDQLTRLLASHLDGVGEIRAVDLAAGTGANLRYLLEHLPDHQDWLLVDHDQTLLGEVPVRMRAWGATREYEVETRGGETTVHGRHVECRLATRALDLRAAVEANQPGFMSGRLLLTASALLDLVSESWLGALARQCRDGGAVVLFALTYDGRIQFAPEEIEDALVRDLVNEHQRTDKGFGPALGPTAPDVAERCFAAVGYQVQRARSDWVLPPETHELQSRLIEGWVDAAIAIAPGQPEVIEGWRRRRLGHVAANRSRLVVGHEDMAAWPIR